MTIIMRTILTIGVLPGLILLYGCGRSEDGPRYQGRIVSHVDTYDSGTGGETILGRKGSMIGGFNYRDPAKPDWTSDIRWYFLRQDGGSDVYRVEWTFRPKSGAGGTQTAEVSFDGKHAVKVFGNQWEVISIEPGTWMKKHRDQENARNSGNLLYGNNIRQLSNVLTITCGKGVPMRLVKIPAGTFRMGDFTGKGYPNERSVHQVTISKDYFMGICEVTQAQWKAVMGTEPWKRQRYVKEQGDCAAAYVSWNDAVAFCTKLNQLNPGRTFRLPTEAEWERACRAGTETVYYFGDDSSVLGDYAWWRGNADISTVHEQYPHSVGKKIKNRYGLFDMHGNVSEWCSDWYGETYYRSSPSEDPTGPVSGSTRVLRGGSWVSDGGDCRSSYRGGGYTTPDAGNGGTGFRVVSGN